ncbi:hypothetical protein C7405_11626 [Paraburkholderia caballeronis]|uniref:hypothetical protein n=1 Tax=Paraburkholderia caballeronis TaxID=416943 RepID=UPI0010664906|nr:hypothetical protein [Paraburkholderia caballeronis]TDV27747.1 hypothetical protein C7405_11626 [Paraburkholderia caballeronis]
MADSADFAAPRHSRVSRGASSKRRAEPASSVSADTENKLARAVQSAQRLAQLSDVPRDDSTLDMFPDDPTHALVQAMTIDVRQGTLSGFELPEVVRVAVEAAQGANDAPAAAATSPKRTALRSKGAAAVAAGSDETAEAKRADDRDAEAAQTAEAVTGDEAPVLPEANAPEADASMSPGRATAQARAARASTAHRTADAATAVSTGDATAADASQSNATLFQAEKETETPSTVAVADVSSSPADPAPSQEHGAAAAPPAAPEAGEAAPRTNPATRPAAAEPSAQHVQPAPRGARAPIATPELDRARATAFADTVDALYGVIADQRRAAADLTRRMKWMLAIVAGALLVTVGVGITQTLLLSRLARDAAAQQQRTDRMMQTQQAALASMLERVTTPAPPSAPTPATAAPVPPVAARPVAPTPAPRHPHPHRAHPPTR